MNTKEKTEKQMSNAPKESENIIDDEIDRLRQVVTAFNRMSDEEQLRVFYFLKSKYSKTFPINEQ